MLPKGPRSGGKQKGEERAKRRGKEVGRHGPAEGGGQISEGAELLDKIGAR